MNWYVREQKYKQFGKFVNTKSGIYRNLPKLKPDRQHEKASEYPDALPTELLGIDNIMW